MSTKTTIKRIALVAAVAAAFGGLSTVAANATASTAGATVTVSGSTKVSLGDAATLKVTTTLTGTPVSGDTVTVTPTITFVPATSGGSPTGLTLSASTLESAAASQGTLTGVSATDSAGVATYTTSAAAVGSGSYTYTTNAPTVAGTYTITFTPTGSGAGVYIPAVYTLVATGGATAVVSSLPGTSSVSGQGTAATASDIADGAHFATVTVYGGTSDTAYSITSTGAGSLYGLVGGAGMIAGTAFGGTVPNSGIIVYGNGSSTAAGFVVGADSSGAGSTHKFSAGDYFTFTATDSTAGTQVITITPVNGTTSPITVTITWGAAATTSVQYSTAYLGSGSTASTSDATIVASKSASGSSPVANIEVTLNSASATNILGQSLAVSVSGPGTLALNASTTVPIAATGRALSYTGNGVTSSANFDIGIFADGTAGTSTITITSGTLTIATKTVTFTGSPAKATATQNLYVAKAGSVLGVPSTYFNGTALTGATVSGVSTTAYATGTAPIVASVVDSNGNPVAGATVKIVSSNSSVITAGSCVEEVSSPAASTDTPGTFQCSVSGASGAASGQTATVTFEVYNSATAAYDILATPLTFAIGKAISAETLSLDNSVYASLAPMVLTVSATDSSSNKAYDQDGSLLSSLVSSVQLGGTALASPTKLVNGTATIKGSYSPAVAGTFTISATDAVSAATEAVSVTATSAGGTADAAANTATDAANQATDAANNAIDAANAAADTAQTAADAAQSAADTATQALAAAQDANQNATDALAAAQEATDAGNAATDAANAAADSADAATAAAQDASDKAAAALAAVTQLSAQFTTLAAQVAKVLTAVQAIAKATTPAKKK